MVSTRAFFKWFISTKSSRVTILSSPLLVAACTSKIMATLSLKPVDLFYCLQCNLIERNHKAILKLVVYLHASLKIACFISRELTVALYLTHYIVKLVWSFGDIAMFLLHILVRFNTLQQRPSSFWI